VINDVTGRMVPRPVEHALGPPSAVPCERRPRTDEDVRRCPIASNGFDV